jgi:hypothetical protein
MLVVSTVPDVPVALASSLSAVCRDVLGTQCETNFVSHSYRFLTASVAWFIRTQQ